MSVVGFDPEMISSIATMLDLREPNRAGLESLARALADAEPGVELVADLATGVGKTYIAGGLLDYLAAAGVRNVVIVTPGSTIRRKTLDNLTPGSPKYLRGLVSNPVVITLDDLERGTVGQALEDPDAFKVFVLTVQSLLRPGTKENRRAHRPHEMLGQSLSDYLRRCDDLIVIADEHHVYVSENATKFRAAIGRLRPAALIGLTATPHESTPDAALVYRYPLAEAIADGYVKVPVLVTRRDGVADQRTQLADGVALLDAKAAAMNAYCRRTRAPYVEPVMFVVASTIDEANRLRDVLAGPDLLADPAKVLLVTSEEPDATLRELDRLDAPGAGVRAVVSVSMLKEGWDVRNIYVIASVRAMESQLLTEQILGRGLRLPFGRRTGVGMLDTVEVLSHRSFADLLDRAEALLTQTLGQRAGQAELRKVPGSPSPGPDQETGRGQHAPTGGEGPGGDGRPVTEVLVTLPGSGAAEVDPDPAVLPGGEESLPDGASGPTCHQVGALATVEARLGAAAAATAALTTPLRARDDLVPLPLSLPQVRNRWIREPFSLTALDPGEVETLGRRFAADHAPGPTRTSLEAERDGAGTVHLMVTDRSPREQGPPTQPGPPFDSIHVDNIHVDLAARLLATNDVVASTREAPAATAVAGAFLEGAGIDPATPWQAGHARLATETLVSLIRAKQAGLPVRDVTEVTQARWPDPPQLALTAPPSSRHHVTGRQSFATGHLYRGWARAIFDAVGFETYPTQFVLAHLFDTSPGIVAWARVTAAVPLAITYRRGAVRHTYRPGFLVVDDSGTCWVVEGKADADLTGPVVIAERDAAHRWVDTVNASPQVHVRWGYLLAGETAISEAGATWATLKAAGQTHGG